MKKIKGKKEKRKRDRRTAWIISLWNNKQGVQWSQKMKDSGQAKRKSEAGKKDK